MIWELILKECSYMFLVGTSSREVAEPGTTTMFPDIIMF